MVQGVAKGHLQLRQLLETVAADVLVGHADAAVQLHRLLAHETHRLAQLHLGPRHRTAALFRWRVELETGVVAHRARQFQLHFHVGHAMAQRLETRDRHAELLARVHVLHRQGHRFVHHAHRLGADGGDADVHRVFQRGQSVGGDQRRGSVLQRDFSGPAAVLRAVALCAHTAGAAFDQEQHDLSVGHGGHDEGVGLVPCRHHAFCSTERPTAAGGRGHGLAGVQPVARTALLLRQHHQRFARRDLR